MKTIIKLIIAILLLSINNPLFCHAEELPAPFEDNDKWGYIDGRGKEIIPPQFIIAFDFSPEGIAAVVDTNGWAYIDTKGGIVIRPFVFDNGPDPFKDGLARFLIAGKIGYFDTRGRVVIAPMFDFGHPFSEGLAVVCSGCEKVHEGEHWSMQGGKWGYIDKQGNPVIPLKFMSAGDFRHGSAKVLLDDKWIVIDHSGRKK